MKGFKAKNIKFSITARDQTRNAFRGVQSSLKKTKRAMGAVASSIFSMKSGLVALVGAAGLGLMVRASLKATDELGKMSKTLGISTQNLAAMRLAADLGGTSFNTFAKAAKTLGKNAFDFTVKGTGEAKDAFDALGITVADVNATNDDSWKLMGLVADKLNLLAAGSTKTALAYKIFGGRAVELLPALEGGSKALEAYRKEADLLGVALSGQAVQGVEDANDAMTRLGTLFQGMRDQIVAALAPALGSLADTIRNELTDAIKANGGSVEAWAIKVAHSILKMVRNSLITIGEFSIVVQNVLNRMGVDFNDTFEDIYRAILKGVNGIDKSIAATKKWGKESKKTGKIVSKAYQAPTKSIKKLSDAEKIRTRILERQKSPLNKIILFQYSLRKAVAAGTLKQYEMNDATRLYARELFGIKTPVVTLKRKISDLRIAMDAGTISQIRGARVLSAYRMELLKVDATQSRTFGSGAQLAVAEYFAGVSNHAENMKTVMNSALTSMEDALAGFFETGKLSWGNFIDSIKSQLARLAAKETMSIFGDIAKGILNSFRQNVGGGIGGFIGSILGGSGGGAASVGGGFGIGDLASGASSVFQGVTGTSPLSSIGSALGIGGGAAALATTTGAIGSTSLVGLGSFTAGATGLTTGASAGLLGGLGIGAGIATAGVGLLVAAVLSGVIGGMNKPTVGPNAAASIGTTSGGFAFLQDSNADNGGDTSYVIAESQKAIAAINEMVSAGLATFDTKRATMSGDNSLVDFPSKGIKETAGDLIRKLIEASTLIVDPALDLESIRPLAKGGPTMTGRPYLVGEHGPEIMRPGAGRINPLPSSDPSGTKAIVAEIRLLLNAFMRMERSIGRSNAGQAVAGMRLA